MAEIRREDYSTWAEYAEVMHSELQKDVNLKPCPFCGGEAKLIIKKSFDNVLVQCSKCYCRTPYCDNPFEYKNIYERKESAIKIWNRREI